MTAEIIDFPEPQRKEPIDPNDLTEAINRLSPDVARTAWLLTAKLQRLAVTRPDVIPILDELLDRFIARKPGGGAA